MLKINNKFNIGQVVYLKTCTNQYEKIVTGIRITPADLLYEISGDGQTGVFYDFELSEQPNVLKQLDIYKKEN